MGTVYVISVPKVPGLYKIGQTVNLSERLSQLRHQYRPIQFELVCTFRYEPPAILESTFQKMFADEALHGANNHVHDWFVLTKKDIEYLLGLAKLATQIDSSDDIHNYLDYTKIKVRKSIRVVIRHERRRTAIIASRKVLQPRYEERKSRPPHGGIRIAYIDADGNHGTAAEARP